jgi:hypothetical protein
MNLLAEQFTPSAPSHSSSPQLLCSEDSSRLARRWFSNGRTTGSAVSRVGKPAAIVDGRRPGTDFGLRYPRCDAGFCSHEVVEHSCRTCSVAHRSGGPRANGEGGPSLASRLYPAHSLSGFLSRQEPNVCSSDYNSTELEMIHGPY